MITNRLSDAGWPAIRVVVFGWISFSQRLIGFGHSASQVGTIIVDVTARQFDPALPAVWVATEQDYRARLAQLPGIARVTLGLPVLDAE